jgi:hypothetical protein
MLKGFDDSLARALKVDRSSLFSFWTELKPEDAELVETPPAEHVPWDGNNPQREQIRRRLFEVLDTLPDDDLHEFLSLAVSRSDRRQKEFEAWLAESVEHLKYAREKGRWPGLPGRSAKASQSKAFAPGRVSPRRKT